MRPPDRRWWLAGGGVALVAALVGVVLAVQSGAAPACAAQPAAGTTHQGRASFYDSPGGGNCSFPELPADGRFVALGPSEYAGAAACGSYLDVTGPNGAVRVMVMDLCPECAPGHLDLNREAFAEIADPVRGEVAVTYRLVADPSPPAPLGFRLKDGTSQWWFAVLVTNHGTPLVSVEARAAGQEFRHAQRQDYNYWVIDGGLGPGPYTIRVTAAAGRQATAPDIRLDPEVVQQTDVFLSGTGAPSPAPAPAVVTTGPAAAIASEPAAASSEPAAVAGGPGRPRCPG